MTCHSDDFSPPFFSWVFLPPNVPRTYQSCQPPPNQLTSRPPEPISPKRTLRRVGSQFFFSDSRPFFQGTRILLATHKFTPRPKTTFFVPPFVAARLSFAIPGCFLLSPIPASFDFEVFIYSSRCFFLIRPRFPTDWCEQFFFHVRVLRLLGFFSEEKLSAFHPMVLILHRFSWFPYNSLRFLH